MSVDGDEWYGCKGVNCPVRRAGMTWGSYTPGGATEWSQVWAANIYSATASQGLIVNGDYGFKIGSNVAAIDIGGAGSGLYSLRSTAPHYFTSPAGDVPGAAGVMDSLTGIDLPSTTLTRALGSPSQEWQYLYLSRDNGTALGGIVASAALPLITPEVVFDFPASSIDISASAAGMSWSEQQTVGVTAPRIKLPSAIQAAPMKPNCTDANEASFLYVDDTDDAFPAALCVCMANTARSSFTWQQVSDPLMGCY
jgi:hypothetical protein